MSVDIIQGECRAVLQELPPASVHTCITSPPFYALRDYKLPPSVWGGTPSCAHEWGQWDEAHDEREEVAHGKTGTTERCYGEASRRFDGNHQKHTAGAFCWLCGAWFGCLGLEPEPALYIAHLVEVFAQVHRVLHPSGTVFLNLGDSFAGSWGNQGRKAERGSQRAINGPIMQNLDAGYPAVEHNTGSVPAGFKPKDLMMLPHRVAIALQEWGWWIRSTIVWSKSNPMPESITDRPTQSHEYVFLLAKSARYFYDADAIREAHTMRLQRRPTGHKRRRPGPLLPEHTWSGTARDEPGCDGHPAGRNKRSVWTLATQPCEQAHFATFPEALVTPMVLAGTSEAGCCPRCAAPWRRVVERTGHLNGREAAHQPGNTPTKTDSTGWAPTTRATDQWQAGCSCDAGPPLGCTVMDIFCGSGTTGVVAKRYGRNFIGIELNESYCTLGEKRIASVCEPLFTAATLGSSSAGAAR